jgi:Na+-driven multidrug efflux pump
MNAIYTACLTFTSQNVGARKPERLGKIMSTCLLCEMVAGISLGACLVFFGRPLLTIYSSDPYVIEQGMERFFATGFPYFLLGMSEVLVGGTRGMGVSFVPMVISILCVCVLRFLWVVLIFPLAPSIFLLYISYPVSWALVAAAQGVYYMVARRKLTLRLQREAA